MGNFILGVVVGAVAAGYWGRDVQEKIDSRTSGLRSRAADALHTAADRLHSAGETLEGGLGQASRQRIS